MTRARVDLAVRGGSLDDAGRIADVGVRDGRVVVIAERIEDAERVIDAAGRLVLPGGVDAHCHMDQPHYGGAACADTFRSGTLAAAHGGTTTVVPFAMADAGRDLAGTVAAYRRKAEGEALVDYAIHPVVQAATPGALAQLADLVRGGYASVKVFTTYEGFRLDDAAILDVMRVTAAHGGLLMVHAETDAIVAAATRDLLARGCHAPRFHGASRPALAERDAVARVACLAEASGAEVLIVHVSSREGLEEVARARRRGVRLHAETCPHYLLLTERDTDRDGLDGARFICSPPLRAEADREALWGAMAEGLVSVYASDHSPSRLDGPDGKLRHGPASRFDQIANGLPGLELRLPLLFSEGYLKGRLGLAQFVALSSGTPATLHGLAPRKGALAVGADADLVLWDAGRETTVTAATLHDGTGYTPYEGLRLKGWPATTISRGEVVVDDGRTLGVPGRGRFVPARPRPVIG